MINIFMSQQSFSQQQEDPLSTHPVFLLFVWIGILVASRHTFSDLEWHARAYDPPGVFTEFSTLRFSQEGKTENEKMFFSSSFALKNVSKEEKRKIEENRLQDVFEKEIRSLTAGYPLEQMAPFIAKQHRSVAAFLVGIAKKESDWGKHIPTKNGRDCYNYWGYKGAGSLGHSMGYGCFADPEEAITIVGGRLHTLAVDRKNDTPRDMVVWKCGSRSCEGHNSASVEKWIRDVNVYYAQVLTFFPEA